MSKQLELLVGDNAFHGISHLSQQRARERSIKDNPSKVEYATQLVKLSLQNGANGFMFSVSDTTLSILKALDHDEKPDLYAIVPYAYEYVRLATQVGGVSGLAKQISRQIIFSRNIVTVAPNLVGLLSANPSAFLKIYLVYEISRIKSAAGKDANLKSVLLHEVITDMALGLNLGWFFKSYIKFFLKSKTRPGFETRNFPYLVQKFKEWDIDMNNLVITSAFNKIGFQMNPSQAECEKALEEIPQAEIIAMSVLAAGYLRPFDAVQYIAKLPNISRVVVGVSKESQACETFKLLKSGLDGKDSYLIKNSLVR
jgi:hypothetical protein